MKTENALYNKDNRKVQKRYDIAFANVNPIHIWHSISDIARISLCLGPLNK